MNVCLPVEGAHALLLVVNVFTVVLSAIGPLEDARSFHLIVLPLTLILAAVAPVVDTYSEIWLLELRLQCAAILLRNGGLKLIKNVKF